MPTTPGRPNQIPDERPRLLPRAALPELRQPRAAGHREPRREARRRQRPRRRPAQERRVPRLRRRHPARRAGGHRGALREPLRDVRADHRREPVRGADAHLPRAALHDGRAVGRLRADDHRARALRRWRGQLLRPRRQPPRRVGAHAGPGRRVLRPAGTMGNYLAPLLGTKPVPDRPPGLPGRGAAGPGPVRRVPRHQGHPLGRLVPPGAGPDHVGVLRDGAHGRGLGEGPRRDPGAARRVPQGPAGARWRPASTSRSRRPGGSTTSSSWPRSCAGTRWTATRAAAATSGPSTRPRTARRGGTTTHYAYAAAWEWTGEPCDARLHKEPLEFENVHLAVRSYK